MAFSWKRGSNILKKVGISSIWSFQKVLSGSSPTSRVCPTFLCKSRVSSEQEDTFTSTRNFPTETTRKNERVGKTGPDSSRAFVHFLCARATATPSFIENRTTQNVVGEPLPPTSCPHITAPRLVGRLLESVSECNCHHDCEYCILSCLNVAVCR